MVRLLLPLLRTRNALGHGRDIQGGAALSGRPIEVMNGRRTPKHSALEGAHAYR